eukprot:2171978-Rhodomonas_salina.1
MSCCCNSKQHTMAEEDRKGSPGRAVLDLERNASFGEKKHSETMSSLGSDVVQIMKEAGLDAPSAFFNTIEGKETDEKTLTKVFSECSYYSQASNGASLEYETFFPLSMRLLWNNEDKEEVKIIQDIHDDYISSFKKKNSK